MHVIIEMESVEQERWNTVKQTHVKEVAARMLNADMTLVRVALGISSALCALALWLKWDDYGRASYDAVNGIISAGVLAWMFFAHFVGIFWRLFSANDSRFWGIVVNSLGFALFGGMAIAVDMSLQLITLPSTVVITLAMLSFWAIVRTGNGVEDVSP